MIDGPCSYERHRSSDWRLAQPSPFYLGSHFTCGKCHRPPWPLCCRVVERDVGFWIRTTAGNTVWQGIEVRAWSVRTPD